MYRTVSVFGFLIVFIFCVLYVIEQNNEDFLLTQLGVNPFFVSFTCLLIQDLLGIRAVQWCPSYLLFEQHNILDGYYTWQSS